ncbi:hypothetical protein Tco_1303734 [Tanacetum coccineum]
MRSHTLKQLKSYSFDEIKNLFETTMRRVHTFVPMKSKSERIKKKKKKDKESLEPVEEPKDKEEEELSQEMIQQMMIIVPEQGMNVEALQTKYPIIDWDIYTECARKYWKIIKVGNHTKRLYDTCGVHHVSKKDGMDIYMLVEREYPLSRGVFTQMLVAKLLVEQDNEMSKELLRKIFMQKEMDLETTQTTTTAKLPILKQENENSFKPAAQTTTNVDGTSTTLIPGHVTTEEKIQKKNDVKARSMLLMALSNEHLMTFNQYKDAKTLFDAIQTRFGGNKATKRTQKTLLKQIQLVILGENISQEDLNLKFLRSLPSEWNTHVVVWRNKPDIDTMSFDDLYNNFKIVEQEVKGIVSLSSSSYNMDFVSSPSSTNEVNTTYGVSAANTQVSHASTQVSTASTQIGHFARKCRGPRNQDSRNRNQDSSKRTVNVEETSSKSMMAIDGVGFDWSYMADDEVPTNMALIDFSDSEFEQFVRTLNGIYKDDDCSRNVADAKEIMAERFLNRSMEEAQTESNLSITNTNNDTNIKLIKEVLTELQNNAYHEIHHEEVVDHIAMVLEMLDLINIPGVELTIQLR